MPHFIIDCSEQIVKSNSPKEIIEGVYEAANTTRLFVPKEIKVRINTFKYSEKCDIQIISEKL